jgi:hypothetical protein
VLRLFFFGMFWRMFIGSARAFRGAIRTTPKTMTSSSNPVEPAAGSYSFTEYFAEGGGGYSVEGADNGGVVFDLAIERQRRRPAR